MFTEKLIQALKLTCLLWFLAACGQANEIANLPTLAVLPSLTPTATQTPLPSETPTATGTPFPTWTPTPLPTNTPDAGKWITDISTNSFDDSRTVVLLLDADNEIEGWLSTFLPGLILRCQEGRVEAYIHIGTQAEVELDSNFDNRPTVRLRFDSNEAITLRMDESTDGDALFFPQPQTTIDQLLVHDRLLFGFTPFNASAVEATFDLRGLSYVIQPLREACRS